MINSSRGRAVFSILLGLGLATLFRKACNNRNCLVFKAPSFSNIKDKIFSYNNKCYNYKERSISCQENKNDTEKNMDKLLGQDNVVLEIEK